MISFKEFKDKFKKKFVSISLTKESEDAFRKFVMDHGFDLTVKYNDGKQKSEDFHFHLTVFYTTSSHMTKDCVWNLDKIKLEPDHYELLGENKNIPVLKIKPKGAILDLRNYFVNQGYRDSWPSWKPHLSLSYNKKDYDLSGLPLPDFDIWADKLEISTQDDK